MSHKDHDDAILEQAEAIKKHRADLDAIVKKHRRVKMSLSDKFFGFWENKLIPAVWIGIAIWGSLAFLGIAKTS